ncbi:MAG: EAL domain-containing protein [Ruminococcus sp.]|nr:EAL domain-containing protein [Ruminococcus sp.]
MLLKDFSYEIASICMAIVIEYYFRPSRKLPIYQNKVFLIALRLNVAASAFNIISILIDSFFPSMIPRAIAAVCYYVPHVMCMPMLILYAVAFRKLPHEISAPMKAAIFLPAAAAAVMAASSPFTHLFFSITPEGAYVREKHLPIVYAIMIYYMLFLIIYVSKNYNDYTLLKRISLYLICISTSLGAVVQYFIPASPIETCSIALCLLFLFFTIQNPRTFIDNISGAYNNSAFNTVMKYNFSLKKRFYLLYVTVDDFELIESTFGARQINEMIKGVHDYLRTIDEYALIYRTENCSFCIEIYGVNAKMASDLSHKIIERFEKPWEVSDGAIILSARVCSIGCPDNAATPTEAQDLIRYFSYNKTDNAVVSAEDIGIDKIKRSKMMEDALKKALSSNNLEVMYTPVYSTADRRIVSAEATIRIYDDELGHIYPDEFLPIAEKLGYIIHIGDIIFENVCRFISSSRFESLGIDYISISLSAVQCVQYGVAEKFRRLMNLYHIDPKKICFRISESIIISAANAVENYIHTFSDNGAMFCLENYGAGYSNISYIYTLPLNVIKINRDIVHAAAENPKAYITLESTLSLVKDLGMNTMVEGIENKNTFNSISKLPCDLAQGYFFSLPLNVAELISYVERFTPPALPSTGGAI